MDKNRIRGRRGATSWHNTAKSFGLPAEVNAAAMQGSSVSLPGEISTTCDRESGSGTGSDARADGREVSRGHSTEIENRGDERGPMNCETRKLDHGKDRTNIGEPTRAPSRTSNRRRAL